MDLALSHPDTFFVEGEDGTRSEFRLFSHSQPIFSCALISTSAPSRETASRSALRKRRARPGTWMTCPELERSARGAPALSEVVDEMPGHRGRAVWHTHRAFFDW
jgi:hypothetical protein